MPLMSIACTTDNDPINDNNDSADNTETGTTQPDNPSEPDSIPVVPPQPEPAGATQLIVCGDDQVLIIDSEKAMAEGYEAATTWHWDAKSAATTLGLAETRMNHLDECKPVDNGTKLLVTSSYGWCVLLDRQTKQVLFHTTKTPQAHSAELLPGNFIAVACSTGTGTGYNCIQLYDAARPNESLGQYPLTSAHGVVWNPATKRLYAAGNSTLQTYTFTNSELTLENSMLTPQTDVHDLSFIDDNTLLIAGKKGFTFDIAHKAYTAIKLFNNSTALKSVNYNPSTREMWYTDATTPEGDYTWSTHTLRWTASPSGTQPGRTITIPNMNIYKVRVALWGATPE